MHLPIAFASWPKFSSLHKDTARLFTLVGFADECKNFFSIAQEAFSQYRSFGKTTKPPSLSDWRRDSSFYLKDTMFSVENVCQAVLLFLRIVSVPSRRQRSRSCSSTPKKTCRFRAKSSCAGTSGCRQNFGPFLITGSAFSGIKKIPYYMHVVKCWK